MQTARVLHYLKQHRSIDQQSATQELGITRLSARIHELRKDGHDISREMVPVRNRFGEVCHVARYKLEQAA